MVQLLRYHLVVVDRKFKNDFNEGIWKGHSKVYGRSIGMGR